MKTITVFYQMVVHCSQKIKVPNKFKITSLYPDEIEAELDEQISFEPRELKIKGRDYDDYDFDMVTWVEDETND